MTLLRCNSIENILSFVFAGHYFVNSIFVIYTFNKIFSLFWMVALSENIAQKIRREIINIVTL